MLAAAALLALLALLAAARAQLACPPACRCAQRADGPDELRCAFPTGRLKLHVHPKHSLDITCQDGQLQCPDELPRFWISRNGSLPKLRITDCRLSGSLACWLRVAGARSVHALVLDGVPSALAAEHVAGLDGVHEITILYAGTIPSEALAALPSVERFHLRHANLPRPTSLKGLSNLKYLELSRDGIETLAERALQLERLQVLRLTHNNIEHVTEDTFIGLRALQTLDLSHNRLRALPARVFRQMPRLAEVSIGANSIQEVDTDAFYELQLLKKIEASDNRVRMLLSPRSLSNLPSLQEITLNNGQIASLPPDLFRNSTQLRSISLAKNLIRVLPEDLFRDQRSLRTLDLSGNKIEQLAYNVFRSLESLVELNLDDNFVSELNNDLFAGLYELGTLRINNNRLSHVADKAFSHTALTHVSLAGNQLSFQSQQSPFNMLHGSLAHLDLSGNNISHIYRDWQNVFTRLKLLNLSSNAIEDLADADLQFLSDKILVDLRKNQISRVVLSDPSAEILYPNILLDGNPFICDCKNQNFFEYIKEMKSYLNVGNVSCVGPPHLSGEFIKNIDPRILTCPLDKGCPKQCSCAVSPTARRLQLTCSSLPRVLPDPTELTEYALSGTELKLTSIPTHLDVPEHVDKLILINLHIREPPFVPPSVHYIDLTNNSLAEIPVGLLMQNITLKLSGNPFICDCSHEDAVQILKNNKQKILDHSSVTCSEQQAPWQIDVPRLCSVQDAVIAGSTLAALSLILIALAGLYCRYSMQIKIILYSCDKLRWLVAEEDIDRDKKYDAFVSFSHKDEKVVAEKLVPVLESGPWPLKLCVHYRDWVAGEWIPAQIVSSVEQSRRTIIILSKNFVESVWGTMEFRVAYKRAQEERRTRIVVIILEDAPPEADLDPELRAYLSTNTYIRWGDPWFWEKLRYALAGGRVACRRKAEKVAKHTLNAELIGHGLSVNYSKDNIPTAQLSVSDVSTLLRD